MPYSTIQSCLQCGDDIPLRSKRGRYCSTRCGYLARGIKIREIPLSRGTIGALWELIASADLLRRGASVFRALSPACFCDLIAAFEGRLLRVEVRTAAWNGKGAISFCLHDDDANRSDLVAAVIDDAKVCYYPDPFEWNVDCPSVAEGIGRALANWPRQWQAGAEREGESAT